MYSTSPQQASNSSVTSAGPSAPLPPPSSTKPAVTARACVRCRRFKAKCVPGVDESAACRRCSEAKVECTFPTPVVNHSTNGPTNTERIRSLERRQALFEKAFATLGVDLEALLGSENTEKLDAIGDASSRAVSPPEQFGQRVAALMDNDVTTSDPLRFGRRDSAQESERPRAKRQRTDERELPDPSQEHQHLAFQIFSQRCCVSIPFIHPGSLDHNPRSILKLSALLYWAIVAVGAREADELASLHNFARRRAIDLSRCTLAGRVPSFPDLQGFCIVLQWLVPVRPLGHLLSLCYELDLHKDYRSLDAGPPSIELLDRLRTFCFVLVQDRLVSIATGKPHQAAQFELARLADTIRQAPGSGVRDGRLCAQAELLMIMSPDQAQLNQTTPLSPDDFAALQAQNDLIDRWGVKWRAWALSNATANGEGVFTPYASVLIQFPFAKLHVNSVVLRGLTAHSSITDISAERLVHAHIAVNSAQEHLRVAIEHFQPPVISYTSEFTHLQIAHASVFLLKIIRVLPSAFDVRTILALLRQTIDLLAHVRGRFHSEMLRLLLEHVQGEFAARELGASDGPSPGTLAMNRAVSSLATSPFAIAANQGGALRPLPAPVGSHGEWAGSTEISDLPSGWEGVMAGSGFWDFQSGFAGGGLDLLAGWGVGDQL